MTAGAKDETGPTLDRETYLKEQVAPLKIDGLDKGGLTKTCKEIHGKIAKLEEQKYDLEFEIKKQNYYVYDLNDKLREPGKFIKPALKKVMRTDLQFEKLEKKGHEKLETIDLKSRGVSKYAMAEEERTEGTPQPRKAGEAAASVQDDDEAAEEPEDEEEEE